MGRANYAVGSLYDVAGGVFGKGDGKSVGGSPPIRDALIPCLSLTR